MYIKYINYKLKFESHWTKVFASVDSTYITALEPEWWNRITPKLTPDSETNKRKVVSNEKWPVRYKSSYSYAQVIQLT